LKRIFSTQHLMGSFQSVSHCPQGVRVELHRVVSIDHIGM
jgi:hypothetical protein